jgi:hypothetical protein
MPREWDYESANQAVLPGIPLSCSKTNTNQPETVQEHILMEFRRGPAITTGMQLRIPGYGMYSQTWQPV